MSFFMLQYQEAPGSEICLRVEIRLQCFLTLSFQKMLFNFVFKLYSISVFKEMNTNIGLFVGLFLFWVFLQNIQ